MYVFGTFFYVDFVCIDNVGIGYLECGVPLCSCGCADCFGTNGTEEDLASFRDADYNIALAHLDQNTHKHQDWFNDNAEDIQKLLDEKREAFRSLQQDTTSISKKVAYNSIKGKVHTKLREMQDSWLSRKAYGTQKYADNNNSKCFYLALKTIYRPRSSGTSPLLRVDGSTLLTNKNTILKGWAEHFNNVLSSHSSIDAEAIDCMVQVAINTSLAELKRSQRLRKILSFSPMLKQPGSDSLPDEIYMAEGPVLLQKLTKFFQTMWH
ncbi:hypothetical protein NDU88_007969 [Pleurodeles waltl]|uniref:Uncharacterized protein n=1 Tax=Pleurodeles waltl TaxID=8319 RepID=A0AAV7VV04_PLEWA|nr:hypothetical protein NDU88_007969 [Pleurodeles waltl]